MSLSKPAGKKRDPVGRGTWILAGAAILAAFIGGIFTLASHAGGHAVPAPSLTSGVHSKGSTTANMVVRWHGQIGIGDLGIDLDDLPPTADPNSYTLWDVSGVLQAGNNVTFAAWTGAANPSYAQCHEWVLTHGAQQVQPATGMQMCVLTAAGRTALVTITGLSNGDDTAEAKATVWNLGS